MPYRITSPTGRWLSARAVAGALVLALAVSACGSSSSSSSGAAAAGGSSSSTYQARLNFAKCMRSHGVNVPDPSANGGPAAGGGGGGAGGGGGGFRALRSSPNFTAASQACAKYRSRAFGFANISPAQRAQFQSELVKFAQCMRSHNIDIPDPTASSGGGFGIFRSISPSVRNSPAFQAATKACASVLPRFGRGGPGGGGPPGGGAGGGGAPSA